MTLHTRASVPGLLLLLCLLPACRSGGGERAGGHASVALVDETEAWHARRIERLKAPDGWLSLVALEWIDRGENRVGRAEDAEVQYEGFPADHVGTIVVDSEGVRFVADGEVAVQGVPEGGWLKSDMEGGPTVLAIGGIRFYVIDRGGQLGVRIKDAAARTRAGFGGIERYPVDDRWRITAEFVPAAAGETIDVDTVVGLAVESEVTGRVRFSMQGVDVDAVLFTEDENGWSLVFGDASNGKGTYAGGRELYVERSKDGKTVVLDFNRAYNPPCCFTPFATCAVPLPSNVFPFAVTAGEKWAVKD